MMHKPLIAIYSASCHSYSSHANKYAVANFSTLDLVMVQFITVRDELNFSLRCSYSTDNIDLLLYIDAPLLTNKVPIKTVYY
jgi:hypothetical protein